MTKRPLKVTKQQLETICSRFQVILSHSLSQVQLFNYHDFMYTNIHINGEKKREK